MGDEQNQCWIQGEKMKTRDCFTQSTNVPLRLSTARQRHQEIQGVKFHRDHFVLGTRDLGNEKFLADFDKVYILPLH